MGSTGTNLTVLQQINISRYQNVERVAVGQGHHEKVQHYHQGQGLLGYDPPDQMEKELKDQEFLEILHHINSVEGGGCQLEKNPSRQYLTSSKRQASHCEGGYLDILVILAINKSRHETVDGYQEAKLHHGNKDWTNSWER